MTEPMTAPRLVSADATSIIPAGAQEGHQDNDHDEQQHGQERRNIVDLLHDEGAAIDMVDDEIGALFRSALGRQESRGTPVERRRP